jgi:hypothetical protein
MKAESINEKMERPIMNMNHIEYDKVVNERLRDERKSEQTDQGEIRVVYTSINLVRAGQQIMRDRKRTHQEPVPAT